MGNASMSAIPDNIFTHIVRRDMSRNELIQHIYDNPSPSTIEHFLAINSHLKDQVHMGQLVIIFPPNSQICTPFEAALGVMALKIDKEMAEKSKEEKEILIKHYDILNNIAEYSGTGYGIGMTYLTQHKTHVEEILKEIEKTYVDTYNKHHHLHSKAFLARRKTLFMKLNSALDRMVGRKPMGLNFEVNDIKRSLGLNSKSIIKQWKEQVHPVKGIAGFEENFGKVTSYSKALRYGGYVGIALDVGQSAIKIHEACTVGREQECTKSKYAQGGRIVGKRVWWGWRRSLNILSHM